MSIRTFVVGMAGAAFLASASQAQEPAAVEKTVASDHAVTTIITFPDNVSAGDLHHYEPILEQAVQDANNNLPLQNERGLTLRQGGFDYINYGIFQSQVAFAAIKMLDPDFPIDALNSADPASFTQNEQVKAFLRGELTVRVKNFVSLPGIEYPNPYQYANEGVLRAWYAKGGFSNPENTEQFPDMALMAANEAPLFRARFDTGEIRLQPYVSHNDSPMLINVHLADSSTFTGLKSSVQPLRNLAGITRQVPLEPESLQAMVDTGTVIDAAAPPPPGMK